MREFPILLSTLMVRAIFDGRKTQTRRVVKCQPPDDVASISVSRYHPTIIDRCGEEAPGAEIFGAFSDDGEWGCKSPYGEPGDRLWVREMYIAFGRWEMRFSEKKGRDQWHFVDMTLETSHEYRFDGAVPNVARDAATPAWWRRPSIFMPRSASRALLEVADVRVERLQSINESDARQEGVTIEERHKVGYCLGPGHGADRPPSIRAFRELWDGLNAAAGTGWDANPWVWVVEFRKIEIASGRS
jgi:hypothetical protein